MKKFTTCLQNACTDYLLSLDHKPTLEDIREMCLVSVSDVIWKSLNDFEHTSDNNTKVFGISQTQAQAYISQHIRTLIGKPINEAYNALKNVFEMCDRYNLIFKYGTNQGVFYDLRHNKSSNDIIVAVSINKNKK